METSFQRNLAVCDPSVVRENQRIRQAAANQIRQFEGWDKLFQTPAFEEYLISRGLQLKSDLEGLPHAPEAEQECLGAMMLKGRPCRLALSLLRPPCFGRESHSTIFLAMARIHRRALQSERVAVDITTVAFELRRQKQFENVGGTDYLMSLIEGCPSALNIRAYIDQILECSRLRYQIMLAEKVRSFGLEWVESERITNATRRALNAIELRGYADLKAIFEDCK